MKRDAEYSEPSPPLFLLLTLGQMLVPGLRQVTNPVNITPSESVRELVSLDVLRREKGRNRVVDHMLVNDLVLGLVLR